jgi:hypothetical protein
MTWECPNCERRYPDSGLGLPLVADADEKTHCDSCDVNPATLRELVEQWRSQGRQKSMKIKGTLWICADELEALIE